jgi:hypothetical protein
VFGENAPTDSEARSAADPDTPAMNKVAGVVYLEEARDVSA